MRIGKLPPDLLHRLLSDAPITDPRVLIGPGIGEDAAVIYISEDRVLVAKTDPITFASDEIGWYSVHVNANDIAATGAEPRWFLATLLVPENMPESQIEKAFRQIADTCKDIGVSLVGGHTEVTYDIRRPIVMGAMLGEARPLRPYPHLRRPGRRRSSPHQGHRHRRISCPGPRVSFRPRRQWSPWLCY